MRLIGMLDSPYVRRVAISLKVLEVPFTHEPLSVFSDFETFAAINPAVKAPTLVTDEGLVLMDSTLILDHVERLASSGKHLMPEDKEAHATASRVLGMALAACEKAVQIIYEHNLRPEEKHHQPWIDRVKRQLLSACSTLEEEVVAGLPGDVEGRSQVVITMAVVWSFMQSMVPDVVEGKRFPAWAAYAARAEALPEFVSTPMA